MIFLDALSHRNGNVSIMTDWQNPKVTIHADPDPPRIGPPPSPPWWRSAAGSAARLAVGTVQGLRATLLQVIPLLLLGAVGWVVVTELRSHRVEIAPIGVPPAFVQQGVTPEVTARRLLDEIDRLHRGASTTMRRADAALAGEAVDFSVPGVGLSLSSVVQTLRRLLGVPSPRVTGEITLAGQVPSMRLRLAGHEPVTVTAEAGEGAVALLLERAARELLRRTNPYIVVAYDYQRDHQGPSQPHALLQLAREVEMSGLGPAETRVRAISLQGLIYHEKLRQPERALEEYQRAIRVDPRFAVAHINFGILLSEVGRREEAEASYREALRLDPRYAVAHTNLALLLEGTGRRSEALDHAKQSLAIRVTPDVESLVRRLERSAAP